MRTHTLPHGYPSSFYKCCIITHKESIIRNTLFICLIKSCFFMLQNNCCHTRLNLKQQRLPLFQHEWMTSDAFLLLETSSERTSFFFFLHTVTCHYSLQQWSACVSVLCSGCAANHWALEEWVRPGLASAACPLLFACLPNGLLSRI